MKYLLDTHALLWYLFDNENLSGTALNIINNEVCYYTKVSLWEIAIKQTRKLLITMAIENDLAIITKDSKISLYDVKTVW
ncbi:MAG: hypothetical protein IKN25_07030 [Spirochaetales bacterium]|nr:hypothetical protein [Spirochaetales bacterium]